MLSERRVNPLCPSACLGAGLIDTGNIGERDLRIGLDINCGVALAHASGEVTLAEAIVTAEKEAGGKAINAGVDNENGTIFIGVAVAQGEKVQKVLIDPQTGRVVKIAAKDEDGENGEQPDE